MTTVYRGWVIYQTKEGNYWTAAFGSSTVAATLATAQKWIDCAIAAGEIKVNS